MNVKLKPLILCISIAMLASTGSFFAGRQVEERKMLLGTEVKKEESTQIAFVNQDSGINYKDKNVNYASDLVKSLDSDFVLTNREAGKSGMEDGKYAAMVIIPGNFSKNITTINDVTPSKVEIYYETNDKLSEQTKLLVQAKISDFEKKLNNKLSYMYVSSVFSELHQGQDYASDILKNDNNDLDAINSINDADVLETINLTQLEDQKIDIKDLDLNKNFEENKKIIEEIDEKYRDRLIAKEDQFNGIKNELENILGDNSTGVKSFRSKIKNMTPDQLKTLLAMKHNYNYGTLESNENVNIDDVNKFIEDLTKQGGGIDNLVNSYNQNVLSVLDDKGKNAIKKSTDSLTEVKDASHSSRDTIRNSSMKELDELKSNLINGNKNDPKLQSLNEEYLFYGQMISELKKNNPEVFESVYKNVVDKNNVNYSKILKDPTAGMSPNNTFGNWNDLKGYIASVLTEQNSTSILARSNQYKRTDINDSNLNTNINLINDVTNQLNDVQDKLKNMSISTSSVINDEDYKYINNLFSEDEQKTPLSQKLKLNDSLIKEIKENLGGNGQETLVATMKENNEKNVTKIKNKVEKVVETTVVSDGPIDVNNLLKVFDENYMSRFDNLISKINNIAKTPKKPSDDGEIIDLWQKYDTSNKSINDLVTKQLDDYKKVVDTTSEQADKHVTTMQEDLDNGVKSSQEKISNALKNAKATKENSANSNQEMLNSLSTVLSNSRVGTVENTDIYNFMINPVSAVKTENLAGKISQPMKTDNYDMDMEIALFSLIGFLTVGVKLLKNKRNRYLT